jgi:hypothetical protein
VKRRCWFADLPGAGPCDGRLVRCHLVPRQVLRRELNASRAVLDDPRLWVWGCGGPVGVGGHHGRLDSRGCDPLRIPRHRLPLEFVAWCEELGLGWYVDREFGLAS